MAVFFVPKNTTDLATVAITASGQVRFMEGSQVITAGGNLAALAGLQEVYEDPFCSVSFPSTNPFRADVDVGAPQVFKRAGQGTWYIHIDGSAGDVVTTYQHVGTGTSYFVGGGTITSLEVGNGRVWVSENVIVTNHWQSAGQVDLQYKSTLITAINHSGGTLNSGRGWGAACKISGGVVNVRRENTTATVPVTSATATLDLTAGGKLFWAGGNLCAGGTLNVQGGILDLSQVPSSCSAGTLNITAASRKMSLLESKIPGVVISFTAINEKIGEAASMGYGGSPGMGFSGMGGMVGS